MYIHISICEYTRMQLLTLGLKTGEIKSVLQVTSSTESLELWLCQTQPQEQAHSPAGPSPGGDKATPVQVW